VLAHPRRHDCRRAGLPRVAPGAGAPGAPPGGAGRPAWTQGYAWWHSERRLRAAQPVPARAGHLPDAEVHWPSLPASPYAGQIWAIEVELTPKPLPRTTRIMGGLLAGPARYAQVLYLTAPPARPVVTRAAGTLPAGQQARIVIRDLPKPTPTPTATPPATP
jgi:hypothetical protein